ncbi:MAG: GNAT family N-acetyltransferase [Azospirillum sp.]|nr:GNAT family N-acetyltransferase [Azospirillum sp.]
MAAAAVTVRLLQGLGEIAAAEWDACAGTANPFVSHAFLSTLEHSGTVSGRTGWLPVHLVAEAPGGRIDGAVPMYLKSHSFGEYVFDHAWADAYQQAGGDYYPKLQIAVPFTPVPGPRLLVRPDADPATAASLIRAIELVGRQQSVSSAHVTFPDPAAWHRLGEAGWLLRSGHQYHWHNQGYRSFDDFLAALSSRKRKAIRKERRAVADSGVAIEVLTGAALRPEHWDAFYRFYIDTGSRKWGRPYLNRGFFHRLGAVLAERVVLVMAARNGRWIAGALNLLGQDALYGRHWGAVEDVPFLHFETCYYRAIEFAITHGLARVEAGAQGEHKLQRGYLPVPTYSAHWIRDAGFRRVLDHHLRREREMVGHTVAALGEATPYRHEAADDGCGEP